MSLKLRFRDFGMRMIRAFIKILMIECVLVIEQCEEVLKILNRGFFERRQRKRNTKNTGYLKTLFL